MVKLHDEIKKYKSLPVQIKASVCFLICSFLQKGISTITTPIFTRLLSAAEYGQYNTFNSWLSILTVFITLYLSAGVYSQGLVKFENERDVFFFFFNDTATTEIYTLSLHDALPIWGPGTEPP